MPKHSEDNKLYLDWSHRIAVDQVRAAFQHFVAIASRLRDFDSRIDCQSEGCSFGFYDKATGEQPFGFISSREWLLFSFRKPAVRSTAYTLRQLQSVFSGARASQILSR